VKNKRYSKILASLATSLILFSLVIRPAVAAALNTSANDVKRNPSSSNSSIFVNDALTLALKSSRQALMAIGDTTRISLDSSSAQGNATSSYPSISTDGRYVAFYSDASNLVSGDTNGVADVFVRDTQTNTTSRVSLAFNGEQGNNLSWIPSISADGRYVAFYSAASNLVSGDTNGVADVFVRDTQTNTTTRVSINSSGGEGNNASGNPSIYAGNPSISADGRYVAFYSDASNLVSGDTNNTEDIFMRDTQTNTTTRISIASNGAQANNLSRNPSISADGRYVAFLSFASNLAGTTSGGTFVRDTQTNTTSRISLNSSGEEGNYASLGNPSISADGRYVAFASQASNLVNGDTNDDDWPATPGSDVFVRDTQMNITTRVSLNSSGVEGEENSISGNPSISADGRYVAFASGASNLVNGDTNGRFDVFVRDTQMNTTTRVSVSSIGTEGNYDSGYPNSLSISANGCYVVFVSGASNLVSGDTNGMWDVFVHRIGEDTSTVLVKIYLPLVIR
jgi:Tol biopolymer transport system component